MKSNLSCRKYIYQCCLSYSAVDRPTPLRTSGRPPVRYHPSYTCNFSKEHNRSQNNSSFPAELLHRSLRCDSHSNCRSRLLCVLEAWAGWQTYRHDFPRPESVSSHHRQSVIIINDGIIHPEEGNVVILSQVTDPASLCLPHELVVDDQLQDPEPPPPHWPSLWWQTKRVLVCSDVSLASGKDFVRPDQPPPGY